jgi:hypothetical protein
MKISVPNGEEVKLIIKNFIKYYQGDQIKEDDIGRVCRAHGRDEMCIKYSVGKSEEERPLGRPMCKWGDNIKMDLK